MGRKLKKVISAEQLSNALGLDCHAQHHDIEGISHLNTATPGSLSFAKSGKWASQAPDGIILIVRPEDAVDIKGGCIFSHNPRLDFVKALQYLDQNIGFVWEQNEPKIHPSASIGHHVVLGKGVVIGENVRIGHHVVIGDEVIIGDHVVIKSGAIIGEDGFGFEQNEQQQQIRFPHLGRVRIETHVEVGSLTTVCRGTIGDTILHQGAKIDDHVHIAHNVEIGENTLVIACAEISGGVKIGKNSWIAPNASILNQLTIGDDTTVGLGAVVTKDVESKLVVVGNPARILRQS